MFLKNPSFLKQQDGSDANDTLRKSTFNRNDKSKSWKLRTMYFYTICSNDKGE